MGLMATLGPFTSSPSAAAGTPIVFVVDDDVSIRDSLQMLITTAGWRAEVFASAHEFLDREPQFSPSCLVLDMSLPDLSGLEVQQRIADRTDIPIIFITGHGDIPMTVQAMKAGAVEFLTKPFGSHVLLKAIESALERSRTSLAEEASLKAVRLRYESLSARERAVMGLVVRGHLNKQVGGELGISEITVKAHRGHLMRKMQARTLADLVNMAVRLRLPTSQSRSS